jgi:hypothetical protein
VAISYLRKKMSMPEVRPMSSSECSTRSPQRSRADDWLKRISA